jgi:hypothetical protein
MDLRKNGQDNDCHDVVRLDAILDRIVADERSVPAYPTVCLIEKFFSVCDAPDSIASLWNDSEFQLLLTEPQTIDLDGATAHRAIKAVLRRVNRKETDLRKSLYGVVARFLPLPSSAILALEDEWWLSRSNDRLASLFKVSMVMGYKRRLSDRLNSNKGTLRPSNKSELSEVIGRKRGRFSHKNMPDDNYRYAMAYYLGIEPGDLEPTNAELIGDMVQGLLRQNGDASIQKSRDNITLDDIAIYAAYRASFGGHIGGHLHCKIIVQLAKEGFIYSSHDECSSSIRKVAAVLGEALQQCDYIP